MFSIVDLVLRQSTSGSVHSVLAMLNEIKEHEKDSFNIRSVCCRLLFSSLIHSNRLEAKFILSRLLNVEC